MASKTTPAYPVKHLQHAGQINYTFDELQRMLLPNGYTLESVFVVAERITFIVRSTELPGVEAYMHEVRELPDYSGSLKDSMNDQLCRACRLKQPGSE